MIDFNTVFTFNYWFSPIATVFYWWKPIAIIFVFFIIVSILIMLIVKKKLFSKSLRKFLRGLETGLIMFGLSGLVLTFVRHEGVRYISMRFLFVMLFIVFLLWAIYHIFRFKVLVPRVEGEFLEIKNMDKYRPVSKVKCKKKRKR